MTAWREVKAATEKVVAGIRERYAGEKPELYAGQMIVSPQELHTSGAPMVEVIERHLRRMTREATFTMFDDRWARPGVPRFTFEVDEDENMDSRRPSYGPGTLRLRLDMHTHAADLKLPEANAELTKALVGALAVAHLNCPRTTSRPGGW